MKKPLSCKTRVTLRAEGDHDGHGFGRGIEMLLLGVDRHGSLNRAAKELSMAYSKAWNILRLAEQEFDLQLINRDGAHGSTLTTEGRVFLEHYQELETAATSAAEQVFDKYFRS
jgi:molybdate transport system regulatory protein